MPAKPVPHPELIARLKAPEKHVPAENASVHAFSRLLALQFEQHSAQTQAPVDTKTFTTNAILLAARLETMHEPDLQATLGRDPTELKDARSLFGLKAEEYDEIRKTIPKLAMAVGSHDYAKEVEAHLKGFVEKLRKSD